ncbi:MAG: acyltransferase [Candidatus Micrarchaeia archaeon]
MSDHFVHETAEVSKEARIGKGAKIWHYCHIREGVTIGDGCVLGKNVYVDSGVKIGRNCKIQNNSSLFHGATVEDGVFIGPHCVLANDKHPRAVNPDGTLKVANDWEAAGVTLKTGCSLGAGSIVLPGVTVGEWALAGSGSIITEDVPAHALVYGNPAKQRGWACKCGARLDTSKKCPKCGFALKGETKK